MSAQNLILDNCKLRKTPQSLLKRLLSIRKMNCKMWVKKKKKRLVVFLKNFDRILSIQFSCIETSSLELRFNCLLRFSMVTSGLL